MHAKDAVPLNSSSPSQRPASPRLPDSRKASPAGNKNTFAYIWMSVPKNYRESSDDGIATGLLLGPFIAAAALISSIRAQDLLQDTPLSHWLVEPPLVLQKATSAMQALTLSRHSLLNLGTYCALILLLNVSASWWLEGVYAKKSVAADGERASVPRGEGRRFSLYALFTLAISAFMVSLKAVLQYSGIGIWQDLNYFEAAITAPFYSLTLYAGIRLAHRGFTVGELGLVCYGGTLLCLEFLNLTTARIWPVTTSYIRTYRLPTPLLVFQIALIVGSLLTGFILSPSLVLSRSNAQRPVRRVRSPGQKLRNRRYSALGFYVGAILFIAGPVGLWTRWMLHGRNPWSWVIFWLLEGERKWSRPALLGYWALLGCISVAGWGRQLSRSRKYRLRGQQSSTEQSMYVQAYEVNRPAVAASGSEYTVSGSQFGGSGMSFPTLPNLTMPSFPNLPNGQNVSDVATDLLDAADKRVPTLSLNARRKFFHVLAVVMFVPGIVFDPAFTHLSFGAAFALFTFTEYMRYFAVYPFGAAIHVFMNDFLDHRDSGTAILSHFYLLTGCSGTLWLEDPSRLSQVIGLLTLGIGDATASVVGRKIGLRRWSPSTNKTLEGSAAFVASVFASAWALRLFGLLETFSSLRFLSALVAGAVLEALSDQNDNLTLPLYMWSVLVVLGV